MSTGFFAITSAFGLRGEDSSSCLAFLHTHCVSLNSHPQAQLSSLAFLHTHCVSLNSHPQAQLSSLAFLHIHGVSLSSHPQAYSQFMVLRSHPLSQFILSVAHPHAELILFSIAPCLAGRLLVRRLSDCLWFTVAF